MIPYIANIGMIIFWELLIRPEKSNQRRVVFAVLCAIQMGLLAGLRSDAVTKDGLMYHSYFGALYYSSPFAELENLFNYLLLKPYRHTDPGFFLLMKLLQSMGLNWNQTVLFISMITTLCFSYFVIKESINPVQSFLIYSALFFPFVSMMAMRQGLAISLALFVGYPAIREKKYIEAIAAFAFAFIIHKSAILAVLVVFIIDREYKEYVPLVTCLGFVILVPLSTRVMTYINSLLDFGGDYSTSYIGTRTLIYVLGIGCIWVSCLYARPRVPQNYKSQYDSMLWMLSIGILFCSGAFRNSNVLRAAYYYIIPSVIIAPAALETLEGHLQILLRLAIPICCIVFIILIQPRVIGSAYYIPYWLS